MAEDLTPTQKKQFMELVKVWQVDPAAFARDVFGFQPTPEQEKVMRAVAKEGSKVAIKSGVSTGKTAVAAILVLWFLVTHRPCKCVATSANALQLQDALMPEIALWVSKSPEWFKTLITATKMRVFVNNHEAEQFMTAKTARADKPDALQGIHSENVFVIIDEAFGVDDKVIEVAWGALTKKNARLLMMGNPTRTSGYAYRAFNKDADLYERFTFSTLNSPLVSKEALEQLKRTYDYPDSDMARARLLGEFPSGAINQLISMELAQNAVERYKTLPPESYSTQPIIMGVDTAWMGDDRSAIFLRQGRYSKLLWSGVKQSVPTLLATVQSLWNTHKADSCFIDAGGPAAGGVIDGLRALGRTPIAVNFGGETLNPLYHLKRTEMWFGMKKWLEEGGAIENNEFLISDLTGPTYSIPSGKSVLERKDQMKARGLKSPDLGDALALTFAYPVAGEIDTSTIQLPEDHFDALIAERATRAELKNGPKVWNPFDEFESGSRGGGFNPFG